MRKQINKIKGYENILPYYYIDSDGTVYNDFKIVKVKEINNYMICQLDTCENKTNKSGVISHKSKKCYIHKLVALAFKGKYKKYKRMTIHHKDGNKQNNDYRNLLWLSYSEHKRIHKGNYPCFNS